MMKHEHAPSPQSEYAIRALQRGMNVLDALLEAREPLSLEQICERTQIPKSTAFRVITNLLHGQYLIETEEGYWLGLKMLRFGTLVEEKLDLLQQARPFLVQMQQRINETIHLAALDDHLRVIILEKLSAQRAIGVTISESGHSAPLHSTALGKALAAFRPVEEIRAWVRSRKLKAFTGATITEEEALLQELDATRARGYAVDVDEFEVGMRCVGAPIRDRAGQVIAAVSVSGPATRMPEPLVGSDVAMQVVETARRISRALGFAVDPDGDGETTPGTE